MNSRLGVFQRKRSSKRIILLQLLVACAEPKANEPNSCISGPLHWSEPVGFGGSLTWVIRASPQIAPARGQVRARGAFSCLRLECLQRRAPDPLRRRYLAHGENGMLGTVTVLQTEPGHSILQARLWELGRRRC